MTARAVHHAAVVRPPKPLAARAGLARTFGSLAGFVVLTFLCLGLYILEEAIANPLNEGAGAVIGTAFVIALAATLLFYLIKPRNRLRMASRDCALGSEAPRVRRSADLPAAATRRNNSEIPWRINASTSTIPASGRKFDRPFTRAE